MGNLSITTNQAAIAALFKVMNRYVGNLPPMPGVFPDFPARFHPFATFVPYRKGCAHNQA
jgi:hypothetical protein